MAKKLGVLIGAGALTLLALGGCATVKKTAKFVRPAARCETMSFPIYFKTNSVDLTDQAEAAIKATAGQTKSCKVAGVQVLGLADADGGAQQNLELSKRRAETVAKALTGQGLPAPTVEAAGEVGAKSASGAVTPGRRRTEVVITFAK